MEKVEHTELLDSVAVVADKTASSGFTRWQTCYLHNAVPSHRSNQNTSPLAKPSTSKDSQARKVKSTPGPAETKHQLIYIYEIFGMTKNKKQGADVVAKAQGYRVVIPDVFRENHWDHTNFTPEKKSPARRQRMSSVGR